MLKKKQSKLFCASDKESAIRGGWNEVVTARRWKNNMKCPNDQARTKKQKKQHAHTYQSYCLQIKTIKPIGMLPIGINYTCVEQQKKTTTTNNRISSISIAAAHLHTRKKAHATRASNIANKLSVIVLKAYNNAHYDVACSYDVRWGRALVCSHVHVLTNLIKLAHWC